MDEKNYFQNSDVRVTPTRFIAGNKTFVMKNISSVQVGIIKADTQKPIIMILVALIFIFPGWYVLSVILGILGIAMFTTNKDMFSVRITSTSGETDGYTSTNIDLINDIVEAINKAIVEQ
jgi:hypothetical protein